MGNGSRTWETCCLQQHTKGADGEKQPRASRKPAVSPPDQPKGAEPHIPSGSTPGMTRETAGGMYARQSGGDAIQSATAVCRLKTRATGDRGRTVPTGVRRSPYKGRRRGAGGRSAEHLQRHDAYGSKADGDMDPKVAQRRIIRVGGLPRSGTTGASKYAVGPLPGE